MRSGHLFASVEAAPRASAQASAGPAVEPEAVAVRARGLHA